MDRSSTNGQDGRSGVSNAQANRPVAPPPPSSSTYGQPQNTPPPVQNYGPSTPPTPTFPAVSPEPPPAPPVSASEAVDQVKQAGTQVVEQVHQKLADVVGGVQEKATGRVSEKIGQAAQSLTDVVQATRSVGQQLRHKDQQAVAQLADQAASQVERVASYLKRKDLEQLMSETERFARRQPVVFLSGAFVLGLLAARFIKSSSNPPASHGYPTEPPTEHSYGQAVMQRDGPMQVARLHSDTPSSTAVPAQRPV